MKLILLLLALAAASAQPTSAPSGHWEGAIRLPGRQLVITVDLAKTGQGEWIGSADSPGQNLSGVPLANIAVAGQSVAFGLAGVPEKTLFHGLLSPDNKTISGGFAQGGSTYPFELKRTRDAVVQVPPKSSRITNELEGFWAGALDVAGKKLRLVLKLSNSSSGTATGTLDSLDQSARGLPLTTIVQNGLEIKFDVRIIGASYTGALSADAATIVGEWTQRETKLPLTFKREAASRDSRNGDGFGARFGNTPRPIG